MFSVRANWTAGRDTSNGQDEYDCGGLCVGRFVTGKTEHDERIATGSLGGMLRVYRPQLREYQVEDLELEVDLEQPILQLECGRFVSHGQNTLYLAVLHPRMLCVFCVAEQAGGFLTLEKRYSHTLGDGGEHFSSANMIFGPFGGVKDKDFIAVQSLDGQLHVFEQESFAFIRQLNHVLLPGPLAYVRKMDSLLVCNSQYQLDCYKYHMLASSTSRVLSKNTSDATALVQTDWTFTAGEQILDVFASRLSTGLMASQVDIFLLCDRSIYCLSERGVARTHIKLDIGMNPMCCVSLPILQLGQSGQMVESPTGLRNLLVCSETGQLTVFKEFGIMWTAHMPQHAPAAVQLAKVNDVNGMIVTLSDDGQLFVSHLGTEVAQEVLPRRKKVSKTTPKTAECVDEKKTNSEEIIAQELREAEEMNFEQMNREHSILLEKIRKLHENMENNDPNETHAAGGSLKEKRHSNRLVARVQVPATLDELSPEDSALAKTEDVERAYGYRGDGEVMQLTLKVFVSCKGVGGAKDVHGVVHLPEPFVCAKNSFALENVVGVTESGRALTPQTIDIPVRIKSGLPVSTLCAKVVCSYKTKTGAMRTCSEPFRLPLFMAARVRKPIKNSSSKVTIETDQDASRVTVLFDDLLRQPGVEPGLIESLAGSTSNVLSVEFLDGANATILAAKSGGRYRVQGTSLGHLWPLVEELHNRLSETRAGVQFQFTEPLPLNALFSTLDNHHAARLAYLKAASNLNNHAYHYRLIQKRLLTRFKDKNAPPLRGLDTLLNLTHECIMDATTELAAGKNHQTTCAILLSASVSLLHYLSNCKFKLAKDDLEMLKSHFSTSVLESDGSQMGWEELTDISITHLLRTRLAKIPKKSVQASASSVSCPTMSADTTKLKKHISIMFDRISKCANNNSHASVEEKRLEQ
uniref:Bardet-Biedl syndrome 9 n=1 Tax=Mucochytrium quahogii TaxID=96639 RepID=A0A7S2RU22_9STRA|mmetsp:Transcript_45206/g.72489  ORF Transcript_45206/g.72489 Transcript_45206/m.72489 type:complete len:920 (-) Transcript_45206:6146-8905(-)|eukprot:CAMPEP_0203752568 /NCGR_PEP_ID=MMETSP0098-20131031/6476_1 /ASSEMBLY_ACC=CAM_ASM_000208 /TAXON_ID=96639 /ORGANISM=" , Strain NY0313808BC1" /LENGTH=919 /DNA_ID=CAMNT_0050642797 /DNA_START=341 /DNA_END=3100 /DNA_ORIENTATION=+